MSYDVSNIVRVTERINPAGLAFANFGLAMLFAPESEKPAAQAVNTYAVYGSLSDLQADYAANTETYKAASRWFSTIPQPRELRVFIRSNTTDSDTVLTTLGIAANLTWWYWTFFTKDVYADEANMAGLATWADANRRFIANCSTAADIRDPGDTTDIASTLTTAGNRHIYTLSHATDDYAGISLAAKFAAVNYSGQNTTITGEFQKLSGVPAESLTGTEYSAMKQPTKKAVFYAVVDLQGSVDNGQVINSYSHSAFGEYIDDVINLDALVNDIKVTMYNRMTKGQKVGQDPIGQSLLNGAAKESCQRYLANGFLGSRIYTDPDDGVEKYTAGFEILTKPTDILTISDSARASREAAPIRVRVFRKGAVHFADIDLSVY